MNKRGFVRMKTLLKKLAAVLAVLCISTGFAGHAWANGTVILDQAKLEEIDAYLNEQFEIAGFPGGAYAVVDHGQIAVAKGIGYADLKTKQPATEHTVYAIASITKTLTAAAVLKLADQGLIGLDRPVVDYLPWFQYRNKAQSDKVTIRHLLTHSAGVNRFSQTGPSMRTTKTTATPSKTPSAPSAPST